MVKITIQLEDIIKGEEFKSQVVSILGDKGLPLSEKHASLCVKDMPRISILDEVNDLLMVEYDNKSYNISIPRVKQETLCAGLSCLFGYGILKHDYKLSVFNELDEKAIKQYMKLAVEIWERNIHWDWMRNYKNYKTHNGSKDHKFLQGIILDWPAKSEAIKTHNERSDKGEKGETRHHIFRDPEKLMEFIRTEGKNVIKHELLVESMYDQATATTRIWYPKRKKDLPDYLSFEERLIENRDEGYYCNLDFRWMPGVFGFTNNYEDNIWGIWVEAHKEFRKYWTTKFGQNEEFWQPPAPTEKLD